jgi:hypothetical protein
MITTGPVLGYNPPDDCGTSPYAVIQRSVDMPAEVGDVAPDFKLPSPDHGEITLSQYHGDKTVVLSFHVFDFTAG